MHQASVAVPEVVDHPGCPGLKRRQLIFVDRNGKGQPARGRRRPEEHIGQGMAPLLPRIPEQQQPPHLLVPLAAEDGPTAHQHHHGAGVGGGHGADQGHLFGRQAEVGAIAGSEVAPLAGGGMAGEPGDQPGEPAPVAPPAGPCAVLSQPVGGRDLLQDRGDVGGVDVLPFQLPVEPRHHHRRVAAGRQGRRLFWPAAVVVVDWQLGPCCPQALQGCHHGAGGRAGVRRAPIAQVGCGRVGTDHRQRLQLPQGQQVTLIAQQHDGLSRRFPGQGQMLRATAQRHGVGAGGHAQLHPQLAQHGVVDPRLWQFASGEAIGEAA